MLILVLIAVLFSCKPCWQRYKIWKWKNRLQLKKHVTNLDKVSATTNGFKLSRMSRQDNDAYEYVYGEIDSMSLLALLSLIKPGPSTVFYDLGSGSGKAVLACAMVFDIKKACGIELFPALDQAAKQQLAQLALMQDYPAISQKIAFVCGNFLDANLTDATVIFISATALFGDTWIRLNQKLEQLTHSPIIITTTKKLLSWRSKVHHQTRVQMSWGRVTAYIQQIEHQPN